MQILRTLLAQGSTSPTHREIARTANVGDRTVAKLVNDLGASRFVEGGRPARLGPGLGVVLGISVGLERLRAGIVDASGNLHCAVEEPPTVGQRDAPPGELLARIRAMGADVLAQALDDERLWAPAGRRSIPLLGVAVAWPCPVDREARAAGNILRHADWTQSQGPGRGVVSLSDRTAETFAPVFGPDRCHSLNSANADALAVAFDQARERATDPEDDQWRVILAVRIGGTLNAATITQGPHRPSRLSFVDARLISGTNGLAGELGHLPIPVATIERRNDMNPFDDLAPLDWEQAKCVCGRRRHLDAFASGRAFVDRMEASGYQFPSDPLEKAEVIRSALGGELDMRQTYALQDVGRIVGRALASPILMLDPHSITLTGSLGIEPVAEGVMLEQTAWKNGTGDTVTVGFAGGDEGAYSGVRGAALAVIRRSVYRKLMEEGDWLQPPLDFGEDELERLATDSSAAGEGGDQPVSRSI